MKNALLIISLFFFGYVSKATNYYISPTGSDNNPGTITQPWKNWERISAPRWNNILQPGDIVYIRGGSYISPHANDGVSEAVYWSGINGNASNYITIQAYPGEYPVLDCSNMTDANTSYSDKWMLYMTNSSYVKVKGLHLKNIKQIQNGSGVSRGFGLSGCNFITLEQVEVDHCGGNGFDNSNSDDITYINCDSHHNADALTDNGADAFDNADGFGRSSNPSTRTTYIGCRSWLNCDDGWDFIDNSGTVTLSDCWAFWNGRYQQPNGTIISAGNGEGFKLGFAGAGQTNIVTRWLNNCLAFENDDAGFNNNGDPQTRYQLHNCTAYGNAAVGFEFGYGSGELNTFKNNISYQNTGGAIKYYGANTNNNNNTWNLPVTVTNADFLSVSSVGMDGTRGVNGALPVTNFLKLSSSSDLINKGVNVGLPYVSSAPDLGSYESNGSSSNLAPIANAGLDQTVTLPTSSVNLNGTGTDPDGTISSYLWTKTSGPTSGTISNNTVATTAITGLVQGTYQFQLSVTDNTGTSTADIIQVIVNAVSVNTAPIANAGTDKIVVLPITTVSLTGTGTDPGGSISSYLWTKISGPTGGTIATATTATTSISALTAGVYKFELKVTDNVAAIGRDTVQVTVNTAGNQVPTANAGADKTVVLPTSTVSLTGTGTDTDGTIASYLWTKISGPTGGTIATATTATTSISALTAGVYKFELKVTDNIAAIGRDTVQVTVNTASTVNNAYGGVRWAIPGKIEAENFDIGGQNAAYYDITTGNSGGEYRSTEDVDIELSSEVSPNVGYIVAGEWMKYSVTVISTGMYTILARVSSPNAGTSMKVEMDGTVIATIAIPNTGGFQAWQTVTIPNVSLVAGNKVMRIYAVSSDFNLNYLTYTINASGNLSPTANAGADKSITLPVSTVSLTGTGTDADGTIASYLWTKVSGPTGGTIATATTATTSISALTAGVYKFELKVTDNVAAIGRDTVQVTVNTAGNQVPTANAGADKTVVLPTSTVSLTGTGTDTDGTIASYLWTKISGPTGGTIATATTATTSISALTAGVYKFELKVTDNIAAIGRDTVQVTVNTASTVNNAYGGVRWAIPGKIEAENFDIGGQNAAYYDITTGNSGGEYRSSEDVDIELSSEVSPNVGYIVAGEWMKYSVNVTTAGTYTIAARIAGWQTGKSFRIEMDGTVIATVNVPNTGSTQSWQTVFIPNISLTAGNKLMRIYASTGGGYNINFIKFTATSVVAVRINATDSTNQSETNTTVTTFPLPFSNSFTVNLFGKTMGMYNLSLIDLSGKTVWKKEVNKNSESYNETLYMGNLLDGVYILEVISPGQKKSAHKLIKN